MFSESFCRDGTFAKTISVPDNGWVGCNTLLRGRLISDFHCPTSILAPAAITTANQPARIYRTSAQGRPVRSAPARWHHSILGDGNANSDGVERIYETAYRECAFKERLLPPAAIQQLVATWKVLRKFRAMSG